MAIPVPHCFSLLRLSNWLAAVVGDIILNIKLLDVVRHVVVDLESVNTSDAVLLLLPFSHP